MNNFAIFKLFAVNKRLMINNTVNKINDFVFKVLKSNKTDGLKTVWLW